VVLRGSGGWSERIEGVLYEGQYLDERRTAPVEFADTPGSAVDKAFAGARSAPRPGQHI
jgi:hypothetical protein